MTTCRPALGWAAALMLACACAETHKDSIDASMSQHLPSAEAGVVADGSHADNTDAAVSGDSGRTQHPAADSGRTSDAGSSDAMARADAGEALAQCQQSQLDALAADLDNPSVQQLLDTLLDKLEHGENVPYCSAH